MLKVLKKGTGNHNKIDLLDNFLNEQGINLHQTVYNGIIYEVGGKFYKYLIDDGDYPETLPPTIEGRLIECDKFGNTDYYND